MLHKNAQRRFIVDGAVYFVTSKTKDAVPYFANPRLAEIWLRDLAVCKRLKAFRLFGFCLLPDHFHLVVQPSEVATISEIMRSFKTNSSRNINHYQKARSRDRACSDDLNADIDPHLKNAGDTNPRLQKSGNSNHYQKARSRDRACSGDCTEGVGHRFAWQASFHDRMIRSEDELITTLNYTVHNFQKHGLPDDWPWTSLRCSDLVDTE